MCKISFYVVISTAMLLVTNYRNAVDADEIKGLYDKSSITRKAVAATVDKHIESMETELINILKEERDSYEIGDRAYYAAILLGRLRSTTSVPYLLDKIDVIFPTIYHEMPLEEDTFACYGALIKIGRPASMSSLNMLAEGVVSDKKKELLQKLIVRIEGASISLAFIDFAISKAESEKLKMNLRRVKEEIDRLLKSGFF